MSKDAAAQSTDQTAPAPAAAAHEMVVVHIDAPQEVRLQVKNDDDWETLCTGPCDKPVPQDGTFRITGDGIRNSKDFHLDPGNKTTLKVEPTASGGHTAGVVLTIVGGAALLPVAGVTASIVVGEIAGVILICPLVTAFETDKNAQSSMYSNCLGDIAKYFGNAYGQPYVWIPGIVGGVLLTTGIVLLASNGKSKVTQTPSAVARLLLTPPAPLLPAGVFVPPRHEALPMPPAQVMPVLSLTF